MSAPTVTIAIPTYNRAPHLAQTLEGMISQDTSGLFDYEILIINDGSTDDTDLVIKKFQQRATVPVRCIRDEGSGYTHALNVAVQEFRGEWIAFFDDDQLAGPDWLASLLKVAQEQAALMVGGPVVLEIPDHILATLGPVCRDIFGESPDVREPEKYAQNPPLPSGGNRLVHRSVFKKIGTFDEDMLTGGCDRDFLLRAVNAEIPMAWAPEAVARHVISTGRITYHHIKWYSLQWGCSFAYTDRKHRGMPFVVAACVGRIGQAILINLPRLTLSIVRGDRAGKLERQALLWRAVGYFRKTLQMLAPSVLSQDVFFSQVEFRRVRKSAGG